MEFFASLFPKKAIDKLVGQLRVLQDDLGVFNDLSAQFAAAPNRALFRQLFRTEERVSDS